MRPELRLTITKSFTRTKKFEQSMCSHLVDLVSNFTITGELQFQFHEPTCPCHIVNEISNPTSESSSEHIHYVRKPNSHCEQAVLILCFVWHFNGYDRLW